MTDRRLQCATLDAVRGHPSRALARDRDRSRASLSRRSLAMDARARSWTLSNATGVGDSPTILGTSVVTTPSVAALGVFAMTCVTHWGVGGFLWRSAGWRAWQPLRGRRIFVLTQATAWTLAAASLGCLAASSALLVRERKSGREGTRAYESVVLSWVALGLGIASETTVAVSLAFFAETRARRRDSTATRGDAATSAKNAVRVIQMLTVLNILHAPHMVVFAICTTVYAIGSGRLLVAVVALYATTYFRNQRRLESGHKRWAAFQMWAKELIEGAATSWYGSVRIVHACEEAEAEVDIAATPLVYGYHPHAMIPAAAVWFPMLPKFSERFKDVRPVTLAASVIFKAPIVREIAAWLGVRSVQRDVFRSALREERAVVVCPGGQREMTEHFGGPGEDTITLCTSHRGFIRIAIEERARLVPVVCFGESSSWRNILRHPGSYVYNKFRVALPLLAVGFLGLPIPRRVPITFIIGDPVAIADPDEDGAARASDVDAAHAAYYAEVERLFHAHKADAGFPNLRLIMKHD